MSNIIERFITQIEQFNTKYTDLTEWVVINEKEIEKTVQLSTLNDDNNRFKNILNTGINLQNDLKSLQEYFQTIELIIKDFEQATENTDNTKLINNFKQRLEILSTNYSNFLKRCKQTFDQHERSMILFNEINHINEEFLRSMNEFDRNLIINEKNPQVKFDYNK